MFLYSSDISLPEYILWWISFFTITILNRASASAAAGATGDRLPSECCRVCHIVALPRTITSIGSAVGNFPRGSQPGIPISYTGVVFGPLWHLVYHLPRLFLFLPNF